MASMNGPFSIDVTQYFRLPYDVKVRFDAWLRAEELVDKNIVRLSLDEGRVVVERYPTNDVGRLLSGTPTEMAVYPVRSLPPRDAFDPGLRS